MKFVLTSIFFLLFSTGYQADNRCESVEIGDSKLVVKIECQWGLEISHEETHVNIPICSEQKLMFYYGDSLVKEIHYPVSKITQKLVNGNLVKMYENVIKEIGVLEGERNSLFFVGGYGGCNSCPEWNGLFSLSGELLWHSYGNGRITVSENGNLDSLLIESGVDPDKFMFSDFEIKKLSD